MLTEEKVDMYLFGFIPGSEMLFVDIEWLAAETLLLHAVPDGWTLIYPFFLSSDALSRDHPDPLLQGISVEEVLQTYRPKGFDDQMVADQVQALAEQAEYLMQYPPSRLVWVGGGTIPGEAIQGLRDVIQSFKYLPR